MMKKLIPIILLIALLFFTGCIQQPDYNALPPIQTEEQQQQAAEQEQQEQQQAEQQPEIEYDTEQPQIEYDTEQPQIEYDTEQPQIDYSKMTFDKIIELDTPLNCLVTRREDGAITQSDLYLKGGKIRTAEFLVGHYSFHCDELVQIVDRLPHPVTGYYYSFFTCGEGSKIIPQLNPACDWIMVVADPAAWGGAQPSAGTAVGSGTGTTILKQLPPGSFSCKPLPEILGDGSSSDDLFNAPEGAIVCDMMGNIVQQKPWESPQPEVS